jgi:hypothetical protein
MVENNEPDKAEGREPKPKKPPGYRRFENCSSR